VSIVKKQFANFDDYYMMMSDPVRLQAYRTAIRKVVKPGDVVLDLGAGVGFLSFLALQAGASKVYAVEQRDAIKLAREVALLNCFDNRVEFIPKNSKDVELKEKVPI